MRIVFTRRTLRFSVITLALLIPLFALGMLFGIDAWITLNAVGYTYSDIETVPKHEVALLLGTTKHLGNGHINPYYQYRIEAVNRLWKAGKIGKIIVSGDNSNTDYDEPTQMRDDLIALGIPAEKIFRDYAGFRTLDSIARAKQIFGQEKLLVVSQQFHNERALWLTEHYGISADAFNAQDVGARFGRKTNIREKFARVLCFAETSFGFGHPKFGGPPVDLSQPAQ